MKRYRAVGLFLAAGLCLVSAACGAQAPLSVSVSADAPSLAASQSQAAPAPAEKPAAEPETEAPAAAAESFLDPQPDGATSQTILSLEGQPEPMTLTHVSSVIGISVDYDADSFTCTRADADTKTLRFSSPYNTGGDSDIYLEFTRTDETLDDFLAEESWKEKADEADTFTQQLGGETAQCRSYNTGTDAASLDVIEYYVSHGGRNYRIRRVCTLEAEEGYGARMAQLLNTLQFLAKKS